MMLWLRIKHFFEFEVFARVRAHPEAVASGLFVVTTLSLLYTFITMYETSKFERGEVNCLALNIYHEARGETEAGKLAVGHVVMNRVADRRFPNRVCDVVAQGGEDRNRCQFSWWCDGRNDRPKDARSWERSLKLAQMIYDGLSVDPTRGALWYHTVKVKPRWRRAFRRGPRIGYHIFYIPRKGHRGRLVSSRRSIEAEVIDYLAYSRGRQMKSIGWMMAVRSRTTPSRAL